MKILQPTFLGDHSFNTYPHMNAYVDGGNELVYMRKLPEAKVLYLRDLRSGKERELIRLDPERRGGSWDVALHARRLAMIQGNEARIMELNGKEEFTTVYTPPQGGYLDELCSLSKDGKKLLCGEVRNQLNYAIEIDLENGKATDLFSKSWHANHFHYCPFDENWVAFSHEGRTDTIPDRCWIWHAEHAPEGRCAFDQASKVPGVKLCVGHERWGFHDISGYAPAYAHSPAGKRGLYEIFGDGRPAILRWESDVIWHCSMDLTGRYVAVDTAGPIREEPFTQAEYEKHLAYFKKHDAAKIPINGDVAILDLETQTFVYVATALWSKHPYHPHPAISPNAQWLTWNDSNPEKKGLWLAEIDL